MIMFSFFFVIYLQELYACTCRLLPAGLSSSMMNRKIFFCYNCWLVDSFLLTVSVCILA